MAKTPPGRDPIYETIPGTFTGGLIQVSGHSVTKAREKVAKVMEHGRSTWTVEELQKQTGLSQRSLHRILDLFVKEGLAHYVARFKAYFLCQHVMRYHSPTHCHSFGICESCHAVREFVHEKHAHPRFTLMEVVGREHEWVTHCLTCTP